MLTVPETPHAVAIPHESNWFKYRYSRKHISNKCTWWRHDVQTFSILLTPYDENTPLVRYEICQRLFTQTVTLYIDFREQRQGNTCSCWCPRLTGPRSCPWHRGHFIDRTFRRASVGARRAVSSQTIWMWGVMFVRRKSRHQQRKQKVVGPQLVLITSFITVTRYVCCAIWFNSVIAARHQGLYSLSGRTSYRKISWSLEAARFTFRLFQSLWNVTGTSAAALPRCLSNLRAMQSL